MIDFDRVRIALIQAITETITSLGVEALKGTTMFASNKLTEQKEKN